MQGLSPFPPAYRPAPVIDETRCAWRVSDKSGFFDDSDTLWAAGELIYWEGAPSVGLEPLNAKARDAMRKYLTELDKYAHEVAAVKDRGYVSMVNAFDSQQRLKDMDYQDRKTRRIDEVEQVPVMRGNRRGVKKASSVVEADNGVPQMGDPRIDVNRIGAGAI